MTLRYLSVCSGIEAASVAWYPLNFVPIGFSEIEPFPCSVLAHHYPHVTNYGDMTAYEDWKIDEPVDVLVGGTPCQSFSVAGLRGGLGDDRGNLALVYCRILQKFKPRWFVWENVPGVLSSNGGRDFGSILGAMAELHYSFAYRILDAQYFGVPQRRRRVFVVGHLGDWTGPSRVLFEPGCVSGDSQKSRKKRKDVTGTLASRTSAGGGLGTDFDLSGGVIPSAYQCHGSNVGPMGTLRSGNGHQTGGVPFVTHSLRGAGESRLVASTGHISHCLNAGGMGRQDYETETMVVPAYRTAGDGAVYDEGDKTAPLTTGTDPSASIIAIQERAVSENPGNGPDGIGVRTDGKAYTLESRSTVQAVAFAENSRLEVRLEGGDGSRTCAISTGGGKAGQGRPTIAGSIGVRRLTPMECERLQGFPDNYTLVPHRGKPAANGPRYKSIGNSMATPVMSWIGQRLLAVDTAQRNE